MDLIQLMCDLNAGHCNLLPANGMISLIPVVFPVFPSLQVYHKAFQFLYFPETIKPDVP